MNKLLQDYLLKRLKEADNYDEIQTCDGCGVTIHKAFVESLVKGILEIVNQPRQFEQRSWPPKEIIPLPQTLEEASDELQKITERRLLKRMAPLVFNMPFELTPEQEKEFSERSELLKGQMELHSKLMDNALRRFIESLEKERVNDE